MQLKTSKGKTYTVEWADTSTFTGDMLLEMHDDRRLPEIAGEFDGLAWLERIDENQGDKRFEGFRRLIAIQFTGNDRVMLTLQKEAV